MKKSLTDQDIINYINHDVQVTEEVYRSLTENKNKRHRIRKFIYSIVDRVSMFIRRIINI